ncbi:hypothetical protein DOK67_0002487 [Enterococcus sp. DIV0212c]|nr:hypothetical protein [Enterococcus sp. DIV0212c]
MEKKRWLMKILWFGSLFLVLGLFFVFVKTNLIAKTETDTQIMIKSRKETVANLKVENNELKSENLLNIASKNTDNAEQKRLLRKEIVVDLTITNENGKPLADVGFRLQRKRTDGTWTTFNDEDVFQTNSEGKIELSETLVKLMKKRGGSADNLAFRFRKVSVPTGYVQPPDYSGTDNETTAGNGESLINQISDTMYITDKTTLDYNVRMFNNKSGDENIINNPDFYREDSMIFIPGWTMFIGPSGFPMGVNPLSLVPITSGSSINFKSLYYSQDNKINEWAYKEDVVSGVYTVNDSSQISLGSLSINKYDPLNKSIRVDYNTKKAVLKEDAIVVFGQSISVKPNTSYRFGMTYKLPGKGAGGEEIQARFFNGRKLSGAEGTTQIATSDNANWKDIYTVYKTLPDSDMLTVSLRMKLPKMSEGWASIKGTWIEEGAGVDGGGSGESQPVTIEYYKDQVKDETVVIPANGLGRSWTAPTKNYSDGFEFEYATLDGKRISETPVAGFFKSSAQTVKCYYRKPKYRLVANDVNWEAQPVGALAPNANLFDRQVFVYDEETKLEAIDSNWFDAIPENYDSSTVGLKSINMKIQSKEVLNNKYPGLRDNDSTYAKVNTSFYSVLNATAVDQVYYVGDNQPIASELKAWVEKVQIDGKGIGNDYVVELLDKWDSTKVADKIYQVKVSGENLSETIAVKVTYIPSGDLSMSVPAALEFEDVQIKSQEKQVVPRKNHEWAVKVEDQRNNVVRTNWELSLRIKDDFSTEIDGKKQLLKDILIFKETPSSKEVFLNGENYPILKSSPNLPNETLKSWSNDAGLLLEVNQLKSIMARNGEFQAVLEFTLQDAP